MTVRIGGGEWGVAMKRSLPELSLNSIAGIGNLMAAATRARKGKSRRPDVESWWQRRERHLLKLSEELAEGRWRPSGYHFFEIREPKRRIIAAAPFGDRVVHHALCRLLQPILERSFIARSYSCQVGKGTTAARDCCRALVNRHRYVLKCDVSRFFPSLDHQVLLEKLAQRVRCPGVLELCRVIIESHATDPCKTRKAGLPIGNLTSQLWGNFYLDGMDHEITDQAGHGAYLRYTDDFLLFANDKEKLWEFHERIVTHLERVRLQLSLPKSRLLACREGVPFCGFRFLPGQRPRILGATKRRFERRRARLWKDGERLQKLSQSVFAWYQFSREGNSEGLRQAYCHWPANAKGRRSRQRKG